MYRCLLTLITLFVSVFCFAQSIDSVKHLEIVSELQDSMILINKKDADKINRVFFEKNRLDSLRTIHEEIIKTLEIKSSKLDSIVSEQRVIIQNESKLRDKMKLDFDENVAYYKKEIKKERTKRVCLQSVVGVYTVVILALLLL